MNWQTKTEKLGFLKEKRNELLKKKKKVGGDGREELIYGGQKK